VSPTATTARIEIERRFDGADGGYACGRVARFVDGPAEVTLRRPVPLEMPLDAERHDDGHVTLHHDGVLLAEADPALPVDHEPPARPASGVAPLHDVAPEAIWATLGDAMPRPERASRLLRMTADLREPIAAGQPVAVVAWSLGSDRSATALLDAGGRTLAVAEALWSEPRS